MGRPDPSANPGSVSIAPLRAALVLAYMAGIAGLSSLSASQLSRLGLSPPLLDLAHVPLYAGLGAVTAWTLAGPRLAAAAIAAAVCVAFALTDEWYQRFVPGRVPSAGDLLADGAGIAIGVSLSAALPGRLRGALRRPRPEQGDPGR